jgi:hypothetical protein
VELALDMGRFHLSGETVRNVHKQVNNLVIMLPLTLVWHEHGYSFSLKRDVEVTRRITRRWRWTGQSRAAFGRQYLTGSFYLYHSFWVIVAQPLSFREEMYEKQSDRFCKDS